MTELKALNDIDLTRTERFLDGSVLAYRERIKQEAIKWVKNIRMPSINPDKRLLISDRESGSLIQWIIDFFNLTEEDLR